MLGANRTRPATMMPSVHILGHTFPAYGLVMILGYLVTLGLLVYQAKLFAIPYSRLFLVTLYAVASAFVCAHLAALLFGEQPITVGSLLALHKGQMFYGYFCGTILGSWLTTLALRVPLLPTLNVCAPAWAAAHAMGRLGCFFAGCCYGKPCSLPWAVTYSDPTSAAPIGVPLHPTQLYEVAAMSLVVIALFVLQRDQRFQPRLVFIYAFGYAVIRFVEDFFRGDVPANILDCLTISQTISLLIVISLLIALLTRHHRTH